MKPPEATIIVVEDEIGARTTLCGILEDAGYSVIGLDNGTASAVGTMYRPGRWSG